MPAPTDASEVQGPLTAWGAQTILYTMCVRGHELGRDLGPEDVEFVYAARSEAENIAKLDLWSEAIAKTGGSFKNATGVEYIALVMHWCVSHLGDRHGAEAPLMPTQDRPHEDRGVA